MLSSPLSGDPSDGYRFSLLGKFRASLDGAELEGLDGTRAQFLLGYLLVNRRRSHSRESLAGLFWADSPVTVARKHLRQALWKVQQVILPPGSKAESPLIIDPEWVRISTAPSPAVDLQVFEGLYAHGDGIAGKDLSPDQAASLQRAIDLYGGDLLEGCYQDWCIYERERLQNILLNMLSKLMSYNAAHGDYERAIAHGEHVLRYDRASERTYAQLMRLRYLAGDRTAALRYFDRCRLALREELDVEPQGATIRLYRQIRADYLDRTGGVQDQASERESNVVDLQELRAALLEIESRLDATITAIDGALRLA